MTVAVESVRDQVAAEAAKLTTACAALQAPLRRLCAPGLCKRFVAWHRRHLGPGHDFDHVPIAKHRSQRTLVTVDLHAGDSVANVGVHGVGEIEWCGALRQRDQRPLRREGEYVI